MSDSGATAPEPATTPAPPAAPPPPARSPAPQPERTPAEEPAAPVPQHVAPLRLVVLVSGSGTLLQALIDARHALGIEIAAVGADRRGTMGEQRAQRAGIDSFVLDPADFGARTAWDDALARRIAAYRPDLVVSAGFMRILGPAMIAAYRIINTHPALLPSFPGAHGVRDALAHGVKITGTTCHWVDAGVDTGPIIAQRAVAVEPGDGEESLHERIKVAEREMLVTVVADFARDGLPRLSH